MTPQELRAFCLSFNAAAEDFPFSPEISVFKVRGKLFALSHLDARPSRATSSATRTRRSVSAVSTRASSSPAGT